HHFWYVHGHLQEGLRWLDAAISRAGESPVSRALLVDTLIAAAWLAQAQSDYERTIDLANRSVSLAREEGEPKRLANALARLAAFHTYSGHYHEARVLLEEAIPLLRDSGASEDLARLLNNLAGVTMQLGTLDASLKIYREALSIYRGLNSTWHVALELSGIAHVLSRQGEYEQAAAACDESLAVAEVIDNNGYVTAIVRNCQGDIARYKGNHEGARDFYRMSLEASGKIHSHYMMGLNLKGLACLSAQEGEPGRAAVLFGALEALLEKKSGALLLRVDVPEYERVLAGVRAALDEATFDRAWAEGRELDVARVIDWLEEGSHAAERR
ncbi:MAG TPA: tetratricopeptide repeat protein, partial [Chloroflexia bacterium]|nr:tetratricopeptide repeat protein [Chloroflexia bacterium]